MIIFLFKVFKILFRLLWAIFCMLVLNILVGFPFEIDNRKLTFLKPIDTLFEYGQWKNYLHWALGL